MYQSPSTLAAREVSIRDFTPKTEPPKLVSVITRLNIGGPTIHMLMLTREMAALGYRTLLVAGRCEPEDGDMSYLLRPANSVRWIPEMSRSVRPWRNS